MTEPEPDRTWTEISARYIDNDERRDEIMRVAESLTWHEIPSGGTISGPMSPVLMLKEIITQLELVAHAVAWGGDPLVYPDGPEHAYYSLLGVETRYSNARVRHYVLDIGTGAVPLYVEITDVVAHEGEVSG